MIPSLLLTSFLLGSGFTSFIEKFDVGRWFIAKGFVCVAGQSDPDNWKKAGLDPEKLSITLAPGEKTLAWFVKAKDQPKGTFILLHGYNNCADVTAGFARHLHDAGYNTLSFDMRGNGQNSWPACSFGYYEKNDVSAAIDYLSANKLAGPPFMVLGTSMGAAVGIQAMAIDKRISTGVFDSSFATLKEMARDQLTKQGFNPAHINGIMYNAEGITKAPLMSISPEEDIRRIHKPVLILHGKGDGFIPCSHSQRLHAACHAPVNELVLVEGADHGTVLMDDMPWTKRVWEKVLKFTANN